MTLPTRRALNFYGGKWSLAPWIISYFVPHQSYVDLCFGSGAVLLRKDRAKIETVGDLNGRIVNYFMMLRDHTEELVRAIELTPWAEEEYYLGEIVSPNMLEDARRFHVMCWMSIRGGPGPSGFRLQKSPDGRNNTIALDMEKHDLYAVAKRLYGVQILQRDALETIDTFIKVPDTLFYFDPPYVVQERKMKKAYGDYEVDPQFHRDAADLLRKCAGLVVVSGYANPLYEEIYEDYGWTRKDRESRTNSGSSREESLWLSPRLRDRLNQATDLPLFKGGL